MHRNSHRDDHLGILADDSAPGSGGIHERAASTIAIDLDPVIHRPDRRHAVTFAKFHHQSIFELRFIAMSLAVRS